MHDDESSIVRRGEEKSLKDAEEEKDDRLALKVRRKQEPAKSLKLGRDRG